MEGRRKPEPQCIFDNRAANAIGLAYRISGVLGQGVQEMLWRHHLLVSSEICSINDTQKTREEQTKSQSYYKRQSHCLMDGERKWAHKHSFLFLVSLSFVSISRSSFISFFLSGIFLSISSSSFPYFFIPSLIIVLSSQSDRSF